MNCISAATHTQHPDGCHFHVPTLEPCQVASLPRVSELGPEGLRERKKIHHVRPPFPYRIRRPVKMAMMVAILGMFNLSLPVCQLSLPGLANSFFPLSPCPRGAYGKKKNEFASLPRFLSRGVVFPTGANWRTMRPLTSGKNLWKPAHLGKRTAFHFRPAFFAFPPLAMWLLARSRVIVHVLGQIKH